MSPIGSGLAAQLGGSKETAFGTRAVPTRFYEFVSEGGMRQQKYLESRMLRAGRFYQSAPRRILTTHDAQVTIEGEVPTKGFGFFADLLVGATVTPVVQGSTAAYLSTFNIGASDPSKSATIQVGKPDTGGTTGVPVVRPFDYLGCMVSEFSLSCAVDDWLKFSCNMDAQDEDTSQTLATASYPTALEGFHFQQCAVTVNGVVQNLTTGSLVKSLGLNVSTPRATERYGMRTNALKAKPILNDYTPGSGSLGYEFSDMVQYGLFTAGTKVPIILDFTSPTLAGAGFPFRLTATIAAAQFTGTTPTVTGPDLLDFDAPFSILDNGTDPPVKLEIMSTDGPAAW